MKPTPTLLLLLTFGSASGAFAADAATSPAPASTPAPAAAPANGKPELRGVLSTATDKRFNLSLAGSGSSEWVSIGEKFGDWKLAEFKAADQTLVLRKEDGTEIDLSLAASGVTGGEVKATLADSEALLEKMKFTKIIAAALAPQQKALADAATKIAARAGLTPASGEAYTAFQQKVADLLASAMDPKKMQTDMAQIYANTYSQQELSGLGDFFDSPVGQVYAAKAPQVQQQMQAVMMPRMMAIMPQIAALAKAGAPAPAAPAPNP